MPTWFLVAVVLAAPTAALVLTVLLLRAARRTDQGGSPNPHSCGDPDCGPEQDDHDE